MGKENELLEAARSGNIAVVDKLLAPKSKSKWSSSLQLPLVQTFLKGLNVNCQDQNGETALHFAALNNHKEIVELLLKHQASANIPDQKGCYPLHLAAWRGYFDICHILLSKGPSVALINAQNLDGDTALHNATQYGHTDVVNVLLQKYANPLIKNNKGEKALDLAVMFGRQETVEKLLSGPDSKVYLNLTNQDKSPLHLAAKCGNISVVRMLLAAGFNVNHLINAGTALHEASLHGKLEVFKLLLSQGGDVMLTDSDHKTTIDLLNDLNNPVSTEMKRLISEFVNEKIKAGQRNIDTSLLISVSEDYDVIPAVKQQGFDNLSHVSRNSVGSSNSSVFNAALWVEEESIYDCPQAGARALFPIHSGPKLPIASSSSFSKTDKPNTPKKPPRKKILNSTSKLVEKPTSGDSTSDGFPQTRGCASDTNEKSLFTNFTDSTSSDKTSIGSSTAVNHPQMSSIKQAATKSVSLGGDFSNASKSGLQDLIGSTYIDQKNAVPASAISVNLSTCVHSTSLVQGHDLPHPSATSAVSSSSSSVSCSSAAVADKRNNNIITTQQNQVLAHPILASNNHNGEKSSSDISRPGKLVMTSGNNKMPIEPPTPDHPPPSPETALLGIQLLINSEKRRSRDMHTSTELDDIRMPAEPSNLVSYPMTSSETQGKSCHSNNLAPHANAPKQKNTEVNNNNSIFYGLTLGSSPSSTLSSLLSAKKSTRMQRFNSLMNSKTLPSFLPSQSFASCNKDDRQEIITEKVTVNIVNTAHSNSKSGSVDRPLRHSVLEKSGREDWTQIENLFKTSLCGELDADILMNEYDRRMTTIFSDQNSKSILSVTDWLDSLNMSQYENNFIVNGFDDMQFMNLLEPSDMDEIGIDNDDHNSMFTNHCKSLPKPPEPCFDTLRGWLESLRLFEYHDNLLVHGCSDINHLLNLSESQLQALFKYMLLGHRKRAMASLQPHYSKISGNVQGGAGPKLIRESQGSDICLHRPESLITGCCNFTVHYLGSKEVSVLDGSEPPKLAITKIKDSLNCIDDMPTVTLSISYMGVRFIDLENKTVICSHDISNIFSASQGEDCLNYFAYVTQSMEDGQFLCHVFCAKSEELARKVMMTLGEAFYIAYQLALRDQSSNSEIETREEKRKSTDLSGNEILSFGNQATNILPPSSFDPPTPAPINPSRVNMENEVRPHYHCEQRKQSKSTEI